MRQSAPHRDGHLDIETLGLAALASIGPFDGLSADVRAHLDVCASCAGRLASLKASLADARTEVEREADAQFTDRRLARQYSAVMRRLDPHAQPARVLTFPSFSSFGRPTKMVARRWVAAAAVVGLVSGLAAGRLLDDREPHVRTSSPERAQRVESPPGVPSVRTATYDVADDEQFLVELDAALLAPRIEPLQAIEALTPRAGDLAGLPR